MRQVKDHGHYHEGWRHPLIIRLVDSLLVTLLNAYAVVNNVLSYRSLQLLAYNVSPLNPASGLDLTRVALVARINIAFYWLPLI